MINEKKSQSQTIHIINIINIEYIIINLINEKQHWVW